MDDLFYRSGQRGTMRERVYARRQRAETRVPHLDRAPDPAVRRGQNWDAYARLGVLPAARRRRLEAFLPICRILPRGILPPRLAILLGVVLLTGLLMCAMTPTLAGRHTSGKAGLSSMATPTTPNPTAGPAAGPAALDLSGIQKAKGQTQILILGSDQRPDDPGFRTDVIILAVVDAEMDTVRVVSFPRDLYVKVPGWGQQRINVAMGYGGFKLVQDTFEQNFGIRPKYYVMTNFSGFSGIIDSLGGVDITAEQPLEDRCDLPQAKYGQCRVRPGKVHMDGPTALWYIRSRHTSSDFDRLRRAQEVALGLFNKVISGSSAAHLPELYKKYKKIAQTNLDFHKILSFMPTALRVSRDPHRVFRYAITANEATDYWTPQGMEVLLPNEEAVKAIIHKAITGK